MQGQISQVILLRFVQKFQPQNTPLVANNDLTKVDLDSLRLKLLLVLSLKPHVCTPKFHLGNFQK